MSSLKEILASHTKEGELYKKLANDWVQCLACAHRCKIPPGKDGICRVRFNLDGKLFVPTGYVSGIAIDPIEKKPFFHAYPGSKALSYGMLGCNFHCPFCQNWITSQALKDPHAVSSIQEVSAEEIVNYALNYKVPIVTSTYNEPLITSEWSVEIFKLAKKNQLVTGYVSNGYATQEVLDYLQPWLDLYKVDLKSFKQKEYQMMGGVLKNVLDTIHSLYERGKWVEVVTLIVPGLNDTKEELTEIAKFIKSISPDIPWHVTAYHQDYKMESAYSFTPISTLISAAEIGYKEGLHYVYTGNVSGHARNFENTYCHSCGELLIERYGFSVLENKIKNGKCYKCGTRISGRWY